ncbi:MAG: DUF2829 domain-containing protein, partial [Pseudomonadota bacterium]
KSIRAIPMTRQAYNDLRGWDLPEDEDGSDEGYLVEYPDSPPNTAGYYGYISWSPADVFEASYKASGSMTFEHALKAIKEGKRVARAGWNGKGMFLFLVPGSTFTVNREPLLSILGEGTEVNYHGHIDMKTADGTIVPWLASQTDLLADDWQEA